MVWLVTWVAVSYIVVLLGAIDTLRHDSLEEFSDDESKFYVGMMVLFAPVTLMAVVLFLVAINLGKLLAKMSVKHVVEEEITEV